MSIAPGIYQWHSKVRPGVGRPIVIGVAVLALCVGGFGAWAGLAPLDGAVVVTGSFVATGQNKLVQHLEGGILRELLVREGELVESGQPLLRLDATAANSRLGRLVSRNSRLILMKARLEAELDGQSKVEMPAGLAGSGDADVIAIHRRQNAELQARQARLRSEEEVYRKEIAGLEEGIKGFEAQAQSTKERLALFREELADKNRLLERQLIRKTEVLALQRAESSLFGESGELSARVADSKERMARANQQIEQLRSSSIQKAIEELRATETELDDVQEQLRSAQDIVDRIEVRAPVRGIVVKLHQHTTGGVIAAGAVILELLPVNDELIIEARLNPSEILNVREGQRALVRLTALNQRLTPMIEGRTFYLSADAVSGQISARGRNEADTQLRPYYVVRVRLDQDDVHSKAHNFRPTPGMPADVFIKTGERTFFNYIMRPVWDSFSRAFREQ